MATRPEQQRRSDLSLIGTPGARLPNYGPVMLSTQLPVAPL
jgi:hypothetical protein